MERLYNRDLEICSYSHELLISSAETTDDLPPLAVFHHWNSVHVQSSISASTSSSDAILAKLGHKELKLLHGLRDLGTFYLPATAVSSSDGIHDYLTALIDCSVSSDFETISSILSHLISPSCSPQAGIVSVHFLALVVHSNSSDALFSAPEWKCFIPTDLPWTPQSGAWKPIGAWKPDLEDLLTYPEWYRQGERRLLLQGVSEERAEELSRSIILFPCSEENVISHENSRNTGGSSPNTTISSELGTT
jgi:hypothetical protein